MRIAARTLSLLALALVMGAGPAIANESDAKIIVRQVIQAQLDAFSRDDSKAAYNHASPAIQDKFDNPARFMNMVRRAYPQVLRPERTTFLDFIGTRRAGFQRVLIVPADGGPVIALYQMVKVEDRWRIGGCRLMVPDGDAI